MLKIRIMQQYPSNALCDHNALAWVDTASSAPLGKLQCINAALTRFALVNIRRQLAQFLREFALSQAGVFAPAAKLLAKTTICGPMDNA